MNHFPMILKCLHSVAGYQIGQPVGPDLLPSLLIRSPIFSAKYDSGIALLMRDMI